MRILKLSNYLIILIIILAGFFRFNKLNSVPPSPSLDEVSIGWNAYSILKTGRDEYGYRLPVLLRAYDDWRPALYIYLTIPFIKFFGLSVASVRAPAVLLSLVTILATYFLVNELFMNSLLANSYSLIAATLLAISPWHIYLSRLGHEVGAGLAFSVLGVLFFLKFINKKNNFFLYLSAFFFTLTFYTYQSQKVFTPTILITLALIFRKKLALKKKQVFLAVMLGLILLMPFLKATFSPGGFARVTGASIFTNLPETYSQAVNRVSRDQTNGWWWRRVFDNRRLATVLYIFRSYFSHFDPVWLFLSRMEEESHKVPSMGLFYLWELPLFSIGAFQLIKNKLPKSSKALVFSWLLLGPLPAALATQAPHGMRAFNMLPMPQIISAIGVVGIMSKLKIPAFAKASAGKQNSNPLLIISFSLVVFSLGYLYHNYFYNFPYEQSDSFQYPLSKAIPYILSIQSQYDKIVFSERGQLEQSYMFFLFFSKIDPLWYQNQGGTISGGFGKEHYFGKYEFRYIDWNQEIQKSSNGKTLYVGNVLSAIPDIHEGVSGLATFGLLDGRKAIKIVAR